MDRLALFHGLTGQIVRGGATMLLVLTMAGCTPFLAATADAPSDFRPLEPGAMRFAVESVLGAPESEEYNRATYEFSRGSFFAPSDPDGLMARAGRGAFWAIGSAFHLFLFEPLAGAVAPGELRGRHGLITIVYGPDGRVIGRSYEAAQALYIAWKARSRPEDRLDLLCHAANGGYPAAQHAQAVRYQLGLFETRIDVAEAYVWARLGELGGDPRAGSLRERLAARLDPATRAEADARYATWSPSPCPSPSTPDPATSRSSRASLPPGPPPCAALARRSIRLPAPMERAVRAHGKRATRHAPLDRHRRNHLSDGVASNGPLPQQAVA
jgi:hypothetical protein